MPIYEYGCNACGREFETLVRSGTTPDCPDCHSTDLAKKLSVFATAASGGDPAPDGHRLRVLRSPGRTGRVCVQSLIIRCNWGNWGQTRFPPGIRQKADFRRK